MEDIRVLNYNERLVLLIALEMAQALINGTSLHEFIMDSPERYHQYVHRMDEYRLYNSISALMEEIDPDQEA